MWQLKTILCLNFNITKHVNGSLMWSAKPDFVFIPRVRQPLKLKRTFGCMDAENNMCQFEEQHAQRNTLPWVGEVELVFESVCNRLL